MSILKFHSITSCGDGETQGSKTRHRVELVSWLRVMMVFLRNLIWLVWWKRLKCFNLMLSLKGQSSEKCYHSLRHQGYINKITNRKNYHCEFTTNTEKQYIKNAHKTVRLFTYLLPNHLCAVQFSRPLLGFNHQSSIFFWFKLILMVPEHFFPQLHGKNMSFGVLCSI